jgi:thioredoxin 1
MHAISRFFVLFALFASLCSCAQEQDIPTNAAYGKGEDVKVFEFYAEWCHYCQEMKPDYEKLKKLYPNVQFYAVDWDKNREKAERFDIKSVPYLIKITNKTKIKKQIGYMTRNELIRFVESD